MELVNNNLKSSKTNPIMKTVKVNFHPKNIITPITHRIKIMVSIFKTFILSVLMIAQVHFAYAQTASILPPAKTTFFDQNGKPLTSGKVEFFIPGTTTHKTTWQDAAETIPNLNPVTLDAAGRSLILGSGSYRQVVKDRNSNTIWDQVTSSAGGSSPSGAGDGVSVGTIMQWAGFTAPTNYMFAYGEEVSRTTFSALFAVITSSPAVFCTSGSAILTGLADTTNIPIGAAVEVSCVISGASTVISKTSNSITLAANSNVNSNPTAIIFPWGNGNAATTFNLPDYRGLIPVGNNNMGGVASSNMTLTYFGVDPNSIGGAGGAQNVTLLAANLPPYTPTGTVPITDPGHVHTLSVLLHATGGANSTISGSSTASTNGTDTTNGTAVSHTTGVTAAFTGTAAAGQISTPFSRVPPSKTANFIIKVTPDNGGGGGGGAVSSVGNNDGTLIVSPNTGAVVASLNLNNMNTWLQTQTFAGVVLGGITGSVQCLHVDSGGIVSGSGSDCGGGGGGSGTVTTVTGTSPIVATPSSITVTGALSCPTCGVTGSPLSQFSLTTSSQLASTITDETGTGVLVFNNGPTFTGTIIGAGLTLSTPLNSASGGTGVSSPATHTVPINQGASAQTNTGTGTLGQILTSNGASADPSFKTGGWTLLNTLTAANVATLDDTTSITAAYSEYEIVIEGMVPITNAVTCEIEVHVSGVFQTTGYQANFLTFSSGGVANTTQTTFIPCSNTTNVSASNTPFTRGVNAVIRMVAPAASTTAYNFIGNVSYLNSGGPINNGGVISGLFNTSIGVDGLRFLFSSGNISIGTIRIFGRP